MVLFDSLINSINLQQCYATKGFVFSLTRSRWSLEHAENTEKILIFGLIR